MEKEQYQLQSEFAVTTLSEVFCSETFSLHTFIFRMAPSLRVRNDRRGLVGRTLAAVDRLDQAEQDGSFIRSSRVTLDQERRHESRERNRSLEREVSRDRGADLNDTPVVSGEIPDPEFPRVTQPSVRVRRWGPRSQRTDGTQPSVRSAGRQIRTPLRSLGSKTKSGSRVSRSRGRSKSGSAGRKSPSRSRRRKSTSKSAGRKSTSKSPRRKSTSRSARRQSTSGSTVRPRGDAGTPVRRRQRSSFRRRASPSPSRRVGTQQSGRVRSSSRRGGGRRSPSHKRGARRGATPVRRRRRSRSAGRSRAGRRSSRSPPAKKRRSRSSGRAKKDRKKSSDRSRRGRASSGSKRRSSRSASRRLSPNQLIKDLTLTVKKLERQQLVGAHKFVDKGIEKQAEFIREVSNWVDDSLRTRLEAELGEVPEHLKKVVESGEKLLADRLHLLRIADKFGWAAVQEFTSIELARTDSEEKKLKKIMKKNEDRIEKAKDAKKYTKSKQGFYQQKKFGNFSNNYQQGGGGATNTEPRYHSSYKSQRAFVISNPPSGSLKGAEMSGRTLTGLSASTARDSATWPGSARSRTPEGQKEEEDEAVSREGTVVPFYIDNKCENDRLDYFEGIKDHCREVDEYVDGWDGVPVEEVETELRVVDSLRGKLEAWRQYGAGKMVLQIINNGLKLNFTGKAPTFYEEVNNKSFSNSEDFGIEEIRKLLANGVVEEVSRAEVTCINPMSIASNKKGKKRLCIDLSRHVNDVCGAKKFTIESVKQFTKTVRRGSWCWYYDLKSAFHHITVRVGHRKYLGFKATVDGKEKIFRFRAMPFGYRDASRILTKVLRTPICKWRKAGVPSFIHIDDGLGFKATKKEASVAADMIKKDLDILGLVTSRDKCQWEPVQEFVWCGFNWDTKEFTVSVTEEKRDRIKAMARKLCRQEWVSAREMAGLTGLIISCSPAVGRAARFYTRFSVRWCQDVVDEQSWGAMSKLSDEVREELRFWELRMEEHCSQPIRHTAGVTEVYVCSDAGGHLIGGTVTVNGREQVKKRFQVSLEEWEKECSSTYRELRSIEHALTLVGPELRGRSIKYGNDNMAACKVVEFGSTKADCHGVAVKIANLVEYFQIELVMVWRRRNTEEITLCDQLSKDFDLSEYRLSQESFDALSMEFGPWEVDWFASDWSHRLEKFSSRYWTIGGGAPDAFSQRWDLDAGYFHPPLSELARVLEKVETEGARGAILVPDWPGSEADSIMIQAGGIVELMGVRGVVFESPEWRKDDTFRGVSTFGMRIYCIK